MSSKKRSIFGDDSSDGSSSESEAHAPLQARDASSSASDANGAAFNINKAYAARFEASKRKQELTRLRHQGLSDSSDEERGSGSESEEEDEDGAELTPALEVQILKTINSIRRKDPRIYKPDVQWFKGAEEGEGGEGGAERAGGSKKEKRKTYKDVVREQVLADMEGVGEEESGEGGEGDQGEGRKPMVYDAEQEAIRKAFLTAADSEEEGEDDGLLRVRSKGKGGKGQEAVLEKRIEEEVEAMVWAAEDAKEKEADLFLKNFILGKKWVDPQDEEGSSDGDGEGKGAVVDEVDVPAARDGHYGPLKGEVDDEEDEAELERMETFESKYNFRFEQEGGAEIVSYGRHVEGSARRKDDKRKREREAYKKRKEEERKRKEEELRRLKNLKREEIRARLDKIRQISGGGAVDEAALEEDFDPEKWDQQMAKAFGEDYYEQGEDDDGWLPGGEMDEAAGDVEVGYDYGGEEDEEGWGEEDEWADWGDGDGGDGDEGEGAASAEEQKLLDELYALDYEDMVGDVACRFKYRKVEPNDYGLSTEEILMADDADLNRFVSLKKLHPYREAEYHPKSKQRHRFRENLKKKLRQKQEEEGQAEQAPAGAKGKEVEKESGEGAEGSKGKKRKRGKKNKGNKGEAAAAAGHQGEPKKPSSLPQSAPAAKRAKADHKTGKQNKKGGSKGGSGVAGVSATRLAAYGL